MREEDKERTNMMKTMIIEQEEKDYMTPVERIEEFEDRIDYLDISVSKKKKLKKLCQDIKAEEDEKAQEYLFNLLQKEID